MALVTFFFYYRQFSMIAHILEHFLPNYLSMYENVIKVNLKNSRENKRQNRICFLAIHARENGSTKQIASKCCALALVRQLYHLNIIEAYTGEKKKKQIEKVNLIHFHFIQMNQRSVISSKFHSDEIFQWKKIVVLMKTLGTVFQNMT